MWKKYTHLPFRNIPEKKTPTLGKKIKSQSNRECTTKQV